MIVKTDRQIQDLKTLLLDATDRISTLEARIETILQTLSQHREEIANLQLQIGEP